MESERVNSIEANQEWGKSNIPQTLILMNPGSSVGDGSQSFIPYNFTLDVNVPTPEFCGAEDDGGSRTSLGHVSFDAIGEVECKNPILSIPSDTLLKPTDYGNINCENNLVGSQTPDPLKIAIDVNQIDVDNSYANVDIYGMSGSGQQNPDSACIDFDLDMLQNDSLYSNNGQAPSVGKQKRKSLKPEQLDSMSKAIKKKKLYEEQVTAEDRGYNKKIRDAQRAKKNRDKSKQQKKELEQELKREKEKSKGLEEEVEAVRNKLEALENVLIGKAEVKIATSRSNGQVTQVVYVPCNMPNTTAVRL